MKDKYLTDDEFCINLDKLRLVMVDDSIPDHGDPDHNLTLIYENTENQIRVSYIDKDKRDAMFVQIVRGINATEILMEIGDK